MATPTGKYLRKRRVADSCDRSQTLQTTQLSLTDSGGKRYCTVTVGGECPAVSRYRQYSFQINFNFLFFMMFHLVIKMEMMF